MFCLTKHSTHFIYGYFILWDRTTQIAREETRCRHMGFSFQLATDWITHTFVTPVVEHCLERKIAQWVYHEGSIRRLHERMLFPTSITHTHIFLFF